MKQKAPKKPGPLARDARRRSAAQRGSLAKAEVARASRAQKSVANAHPPLKRSDLAPGFPIVGIGASAGGLEALEELLKNMPADTGMAFVVVTHQHPGHTSLLPQLLAKTTALPVKEATDGLQVQPNHVFIGPPGGQMAMLNGALHLMEKSKAEAPRLPIDYFLRSLAQDQKEKAICIILSGTGTDGTLGLKAIKGESGMAMVQQVQSAKYAGMPSSAMATGLADYVLPPADMPVQLVAYARGPYLTTAAQSAEAHAVPEGPMQKIFVLLRSRVGHDFSGYKPNTIRRRIERRMNLHQIKGPNQYLRYLQDNPHEIDILFKELLISVTSFFRDPDAFQSLAQTAMVGLMRSRPDDHTFRIWVPGCSSGEEAFSLAILMRECMESEKKHYEVQIFGTDLDSEAIDIARSGLYPDGIAVDVSQERLERYFTREDGAYRIRKEIREMTIFAAQNVIKDPPFTKLDMISCRNLLIYLNTDLQKRLLPVFHYALTPDGLLLLGPSETIGGFSDFFDPVDKKWKIFRRKQKSPEVHPILEFPIERLRAEVGERLAPAPEPQRETNIATIVDRMLLARHAPASVVVNDRGDIAYVHGRTGAFLEPAAGQPRLNIIDMAREGLQLELSAALRQAGSRDSEVTRDSISVKNNGGFIHVDLSVVKIREPETVRGLYLVTFRQRLAPTAVATVRGRGRKSAEAGRHEVLERELQYTKESLQTTIEELETSNEELKSTNEELQSTNEELQSTNEELETSKEEMQSLNEELTTVNSELQLRVEELSRANDDMQNLLNSTEIATIFLDNELNIKRFTDQARRLVNLIQTDVGRPLGDLVSSLSHDRLVLECREVLRTLVFKQAEVQTKDGHWYLMRIMPYRTAENLIDGLVLTFVDINPVREAQRSLRRLSRMFTEGLDPIFMLDLSGRILDPNEEVTRVYGWSRQELTGQSIKVIFPKGAQKEVEQWLRRCVEGEAIRDRKCTQITKAGTELQDDVNLLLLTNERGEPDALSMITRRCPH